MKAYIDFGNTAFKIIKESNPREIKSYFYSTFEFDSFVDYLNADNIDEIFYITVAPKKTYAILSKLDIKIQEIKKELVLPYIPVNCDISTAGIDRIFNVYYMYEQKRYPALTIDAGTALNVEILDNTGTFIGGLIMSNPVEVLGNLIKKAEGLQRFKRFFEELDFENIPTIGVDTFSSIAAGLYYEILPGFKELITLLSSKYNTPPQVYLTGGLGVIFYKILNNKVKDVELEYNSTLTLEGLKSFIDKKWKK